MVDPKKKEKAEKKTKLEDLTDEEVQLALEEAGQTEISPEIRKKVKKLIAQKNMSAYYALTFVYYGGPR